MGSASNFFSDLEDKQQVEQWREMVYLVAKRYIGELLPGRESTGLVCSDPMLTVEVYVQM